jgi:hypothetical protein
MRQREPGCGRFRRTADELAEKFGHRFTPNALLRKEADNPEVLASDYRIDAQVERLNCA